MSDAGRGDGATDLSGAEGLADASVAEARRARGHRRSDGAWPRTAVLVRAVILIVAAVVVTGWILTLVNAVPAGRDRRIPQGRPQQPGAGPFRPLRATEQPDGSDGRVRRCHR